MTKKNDYDHTKAKRQKTLVEKRKAKGLSRTEVWVHAEDKPVIRETAEMLNKKRGIEL